MKVPLRWIRQFVDMAVEEPEELATLLANLGHEVEGFEAIMPEFGGVVVGRVESIEAHPEADRVRLCKVTTGAESQAIVCGAWNFEPGAIVPVAVPGARLGDSTVEKRTIRGVESYGMICSAYELGLGEDHEGILVLGEELPIGSDFLDHIPYPDVVFDVSITPNRPDAMSVLGLARDLAALWNVKVKTPEVGVDEKPGSRISVVIEDPSGCRRYVGREVDAVTIEPSPLWMQLLLRDSGVRPISNVVDITNYVMLELGQPLHAFDLDRVGGEQIIVRRAAEGETLQTLDGVDRDLDPDDLMICDRDRVVAFAGIMGGEESEVRPETARVLIEAAAFDPPTVMFASARHGLRTESSARFERGVDPNLPKLSADRAAQLMADLAGGKVIGPLVDEHPRPLAPWTVDLRLDQLERVLGVFIERTTALSLLERLGMEVDDQETPRVTIPTYRPDLTREIDLVEEVVRLMGYDQVPETVALGRGGGLSISQRRDRLVRELMTSAGFSEAQTYSFLGHEDLDRLALGPQDSRRNSIAVKNPLRKEESILRTTMLPGLLRATRLNLARGADNVALFEVGLVFFDEPSTVFSGVPAQPAHLAFVAFGEVDGRPTDAETAAAVWRLLADRLGLVGSLVATEIAPMHPRRTAEVSIDGSPIGFLGELHPRVARSFELPGRVVAGELTYDRLLEHGDLWQFEEPSAYPPVSFDLAFEVEAELPAALLVEAVQAGGGSLLEEVRVFDEFRGGGIPAGRKSLAVRVVLRAPDRTLTGEEQTAVRQAMITRVAEEVGGALRGS